MKYLVGISRVIVGILFIISGFIKLNDPVGFSFKLEEYFSQGVLDLPAFMPYALAISLFVVILEVILGVLLLLGHKGKITVWSLLLMILFFTFLTFYSAYFNKVTDCGCFGDAIKLTPWESFTKDIILLVLILILVAGLKYIKPILPRKPTLGLLLVSLILCIAYANYVLNHLPAIDFRPYKIGANIEEGMSTPPNAPKAIFEYAWKFLVNGEEQVVVTNGDYPSVDGEFIGVETTEIQKGYEPPIHDFTIEKDGEDFTNLFLREGRLIMVVAYDLVKSKLEAFESIKGFTDSALEKGYTVIGMSASGDELSKELVEKYDLSFDFFFTDETTLKTIVRSNPGILVLHKGTIEEKVHFNDLEELVLRNYADRLKLDIGLKHKLDSIMVLDQKYRGEANFDNWHLQQSIDSSNMKFVEEIFQAQGYPGKSIVGEESQLVAWYVLQHSNKIEQYISLIEEAANQGEIPFRSYAMMLDRYLMQQQKPQIYGTQGSSYFIGTPNQISFIWPIEEEAEVNQRRIEAGFDNTVEENGKNLFGEDFEYQAFTIEEIQKIINKYAKTEN